jgi:hypothetical protein
MIIALDMRGGNLIFFLQHFFLHVLMIRLYIANGSNHANRSHTHKLKHVCFSIVFFKNIFEIFSIPFKILEKYPIFKNTIMLNFFQSYGIYKDNFYNFLFLIFNFQLKTLVT